LDIARIVSHIPAFHFSKIFFTRNLILSFAFILAIYKLCLY